MNSSSFGEKIRELREKRDLTQKALARLAGLNVSTLGRIERNEHLPEVENVKLLAKALNKEQSELLSEYFSEKVVGLLAQYHRYEDVLRRSQKKLKNRPNVNVSYKSRDEIISDIQGYLKTLPIEKAWIFGSFTRDTRASKYSDLDLMVKFRKPHKITLFDLADIRRKLTELTGRQIDLVQEEQVHQQFQEDIVQDRIQVYG